MKEPLLALAELQTSIFRGRSRVVVREVVVSVQENGDGKAMAVFDLSFSSLFCH